LKTETKRGLSLLVVFLLALTTFTGIIPSAGMNAQENLQASEQMTHSGKITAANSGLAARGAVKNVTLSNAKFAGLTQVSVNTSVKLKGITADDIVITAGNYTVPANLITKVTVADDKITVSLDPAAFAYNSSVAATIATKAFDSFGAGAAVSIAPGGDPLDAAVWSKITTANPGDNSLWHNLTDQTCIKADPTPYTVPSHGPIYKQIGKLKGLMIVIDFPDARAADNTGSNALPGKDPVDEGNRVHGHILKTAQDCYDWLMPRAHDFYDTASYGQLDLDVTLVENPDAVDGVFTCQGLLYDVNEYNVSGKPYAMDRGGDVSSYVRDALSVAKPVLQDYPDGPYDIIYVVAAENAVGISYGPMDTSNYNASYSGRTDLKALVRIGYDTYSRWRSKAVNHETGHAIGAPDYYVNAFSGYGGGQCDPNTGTADYYPMVGHWDIMGYINGPAPDFFAWMKWRFGWIRDDQVDIITSDGTTTHELTPVEVPGGTKMIVIPGPINGVVYVIENRQIAGVDNTAVNEQSTDPDPDHQNSNWSHIYDTFNSPGILMYKIDANVASLSGPLTVIELNPDNAIKELGTSLDSSVLGASSGIYTYTDVAAGITVTLDNETGSVSTVTVTKNTPAAAVKPVLSEARFIDLTTVEFKTDLDLRGITANKIVLKKGTTNVRGVKINQITPRSIRITCNSGQFAGVADMEGATVSTDAFSFFGASAPVSVTPCSTVAGPVLSEAKFNSLTQIQAESDVDLTGIAAANIVIKKANGSTVAQNKITGVTFDPVTMLLKVDINADQFIDGESTAGTTIATTMFSNFQPAVLNLQMAKFNHPVTVREASAEVSVAGFNLVVTGIEITTLPVKIVYAVGDTLDLSGMVITATLEDGSTQAVTVTAENVSGFDSSAPAENQVLTVTCGGQTATFTVSITEATVSFDAQADYKMVNKNSTDVLDTGGSDETLVTLWDYTLDYPDACDEAKWKMIDAGDDYYRIVSKATQRYLIASSTEDGASIVQAASVPGDNSGYWHIQSAGDGYYSIINKKSGKALEVKDSSTEDGAEAVQNPYTGADNQIWKIIETEQI